MEDWRGLEWIERTLETGGPFHTPQVRVVCSPAPFDMSFQRKGSVVGRNLTQSAAIPIDTSSLSKHDTNGRWASFHPRGQCTRLVTAHANQQAEKRAAKEDVIFKVGAAGACFWLTGSATKLWCRAGRSTQLHVVRRAAQKYKELYHLEQ